MHNKTIEAMRSAVEAMNEAIHSLDSSRPTEPAPPPEAGGELYPSDVLLAEVSAALSKADIEYERASEYAQLQRCFSRLRNRMRLAVARYESSVEEIEL